MKKVLKLQTLVLILMFFCFGSPVLGHSDQDSDRLYQPREIKVGETSYIGYPVLRHQLKGIQEYIPLSSGYYQTVNRPNDNLQNASGVYQHEGITYVPKEGQNDKLKNLNGNFSYSVKAQDNGRDYRFIMIFDHSDTYTLKASGFEVNLKFAPQWGSGTVYVYTPDNQDLTGRVFQTTFTSNEDQDFPAGFKELEPNNLSTIAEAKNDPSVYEFFWNTSENEYSSKRIRAAFEFTAHLYTLNGQKVSSELTASIVTYKLVAANRIAEEHSVIYNAAFEGTVDGKVTTPKITFYRSGFYEFHLYPVLDDQKNNEIIDFSIPYQKSPLKIEVTVGASVTGQGGNLVKNLRISTKKITGNFYSSNYKLYQKEEMIENAIIANVVKNENKKEIFLKTDEKYSLDGRFEPSSVSNQNMVWESSAPDIVSIDQKGQMTAHCKGSATITMSHQKYNTFTDSVEVHVQAPEEGDQNILRAVSIEESQISLEVGNELNIPIHFIPENIKEPELKVKTETVTKVKAQIDGNILKIRALEPGAEKIILTSSNNPQIFTQIDINVLPKIEIEEDYVRLESFRSYLNKNAVRVGEEVQISTSFKPETASNKNLSLVSENHEIVELKDGKLIAKGIGTTNILVFAEGLESEFPQKLKINVVSDKGLESSSDALNSASSNVGLIIGDQKPDNIRLPNQPSTVKGEIIDGSETQMTAPEKKEQEKTEKGITVYRIYNQILKEHLYTTDLNEIQTLSKEKDWILEVSKWRAPKTGTPVYRLYSFITGRHLYTTDLNEVEVLTQNAGWISDNNGRPVFYSGGKAPVYRIYHEGLRQHHLTTDQKEYRILSTQGWSPEGIKLFALEN